MLRQILEIGDSISRLFGREIGQWGFSGLHLLTRGGGIAFLPGVFKLDFFFTSFNSLQVFSSSRSAISLTDIFPLQNLLYQSLISIEQCSSLLQYASLEEEQTSRSTPPSSLYFPQSPKKKKKAESMVLPLPFPIFSSSPLSNHILSPRNRDP